VCGACFPKHFWAPNNIIKYNAKPIPAFGWRSTTSRGWHAGRTMTFSTSNSSPIYLFNMSRAWLDHLPRNSIDCWEDLKEIFTNNFQGTHVWPDNP
jgi:hypothetical protein